MDAVMEFVNDYVRSVKSELESVKSDLGSVKLAAEENTKRISELGRSTMVGSLSASNSDHGYSIYKSLSQSDDIKTATEVAGSPSVLTQDMVAEAQRYCEGKSTENMLVSLYTPALMGIIGEVSPQLRLINSEHSAWLKSKRGHPKSNLKPDLFSAYYPLIKYCLLDCRAPKCDANQLFGKFECWESRSSIHCIFDATWKIDMGSFGEKCKYLQTAGEGCNNHNGVPVMLRGVLFDKDQFWLIRSCGISIISVVQCPWTQAGSKQLLSDFLKIIDPWLDATEDLCKRLDVSIKDFSTLYGTVKQRFETEPAEEQAVQEQVAQVHVSAPQDPVDEDMGNLTLQDQQTVPGQTEAVTSEEKETIVAEEKDLKDGQSAFLGCGAYGRVFSLTNNQAVKIVVGTASERLEKEYLAMIDFFENESVKDLIFPVVKDSFRTGAVKCGSFDVSYAGYLLDGIGTQLQSPPTAGAVSILGRLLNQLHANDIIHGDPQYQNIVLLDGKPRWIDFFHDENVPNEYRRKRDMQIYFTSVGGSENLAELEIAAYAKSPTWENMCRVLGKL
jgi:hypothetical protein